MFIIKNPLLRGAIREELRKYMPLDDSIPQHLADKTRECLCHKLAEIKNLDIKGDSEDMTSLKKVVNVLNNFKDDLVDYHIKTLSAAADPAEFEKVYNSSPHIAYKYRDELVDIGIEKKTAEGLIASMIGISAAIVGKVRENSGIRIERASETNPVMPRSTFAPEAERTYKTYLSPDYIMNSQKGISR